ncbi:hypothetical protein [uncultured Roseobacter sp.]|uniref:hypothetical protein n=1 Tax=uncultured Roseobacter sp. TaxID=114847 RepID=UPI002622BB5B|nr:hypothetical protein [uncultured Roseobacter sp.]
MRFTSDTGAWIKVSAGNRRLFEAIEASDQLTSEAAHSRPTTNDAKALCETIRSLCKDALTIDVTAERPEGANFENAEGISADELAEAFCKPEGDDTDILLLLSDIATSTIKCRQGEEEQILGDLETARRLAVFRHWSATHTWDTDTPGTVMWSGGLEGDVSVVHHKNAETEVWAIVGPDHKEHLQAMVCRSG